MYKKIQTGKKNNIKITKFKKYKPIIVTGIISAVFLVFVSNITVRGFINLVRNNKEKKSASVLVSTPTPDPLAPKNILLLGYGGGVHEGGSLTDTMIIAHIIPREKRIIMVSVPRDLWIPLPVKGETLEYHKINEAFPIGKNDKQYKEKPEKYKGLYGGGTLVKYAAGFVTGMKMDKYLAVNFKGFSEIIDILGGVDVDVPYSFTDEFYPVDGKENDVCEKSEEDVKKLTATMSGDLLFQQFSCRFERLEFQKGRMHLDGITALKFVRSRHSYIEGSDFGRSKRQQAFLKGLKEKILSPAIFVKIVPLFQSFLKNTETDLNIDDISEMLNKYSDIKDYKIETIVLSDTNALQQTTNEKGTYILIPKESSENWKVIENYINNQIYPTVNP